MRTRKHIMWVLYHPHIGIDGSVWTELFFTRKDALAARKRPKLKKYTPNPRHGFPAVGQPVKVTIQFEKVRGHWKVKP